MKLRRLTQGGIDRLHEFLNSLVTGNPQSYPDKILTDPMTSEEVDSGVDIEKRTFGNRFNAAKYLNRKLSVISIADLYGDVGLWAWLSLFYFDELCPSNMEGKRQPKDRARYIPEVTNWRKYYRHLLAGPYRVYQAHNDDPDRAMSLLRGPLDKPGDIVEQLTSRQEIVTNKGIIEAATLLYIDPVNKGTKRGAAGKGDGSARRLADVCNQFDLTWDLYSMSSNEFILLLPQEFNRFRPKTD